MNTVLVVEKTQAIRYMLHTILGKSNKVVSVPNGAAAIYWLTVNDIPDFIITDPFLEDLPNCEFLDYLKDNRWFHHVPCLVMAKISKEQKEKLLTKYNPAAFFDKPFDPVDIANMVDNNIRKSLEKTA